MKNIFFAFLILFLFTACEDETVTSAISGTIYADCRLPLASKEIALKVDPSVSSFNDARIIASTVTNSSGQFYMTYELDETESGKLDLIAPNSQGFNTLIQQIEINKDYELELFESNQSSIQLSLNGSRVWQPTDTLFYGVAIDFVDQFIVSPTNGSIDTLNYAVANLLNSNTTATWLYYGIGQQNFQLAKEAAGIQDSIFQNIQLFLEGCSQEEQVEIQIN